MEPFVRVWIARVSRKSSLTPVPSRVQSHFQIAQDECEAELLKQRTM